MWNLNVEVWKWKASKSGSGGEKVGSGCEDSAFKQQIGGHRSWLDAISLGSRSRQQQIVETRTAHGWTSLTWQVLVAASFGSSRSWFQQLAATDRGLLCVSLVVAGCGLMGALFVFEFDSELVICEVVNLWWWCQRVCVRFVNLWIVEWLCATCVCCCVACVCAAVQHVCVYCCAACVCYCTTYVCVRCCTACVCVCCTVLGLVFFFFLQPNRVFESGRV